MIPAYLHNVPFHYFLPALINIHMYSATALLMLLGEAELEKVHATAKHFINIIIIKTRFKNASSLAYIYTLILGFKLLVGLTLNLRPNNEYG